jgi:hypothetical protein
MPDFETDYLVIGAGAMGMAFTDVLLRETDASVVIVDKRGRPGGHWNDAYPYVRLHQPSAFYGVESKVLGSGAVDATGWNKGLYELASGHEVLAYFDQILQQHFLPSGRVQYFPMSEHLGEGRFRSLVSGAESRVQVRRRTVDAGYMNVTVPSMRAPSYEVAPGARCVPPNELPRTRQPADGYVVIGAGKTGMDACLWLLANGVDPAAISWIMPRDSWLLDRAKIQPGAEFFDATMGGSADELEQIAEASSIDDLFFRLEAHGRLLRLDESVQPTMYRCATVTLAELEQLRRISNVVRLGRVRRLHPDEIALDGGSIPTSPGTLHVDCTADGLERRPVVPVFAGDRLTLQSVRTCQQVFSAAFTAHVESAYEDDSLKNELCTVIPHPDSHLDWLRCSLANTLNDIRWAQDEDLARWLGASRLNVLAAFLHGVDPGRAAPKLERIEKSTGAALTKLTQLLEEPGDRPT